jgi:PAS domain S-box-containing protein
VEDEAIIAMKEEDILAKNRFKVKTVYTAEAAIQAVKTGAIDLVLIESINMAFELFYAHKSLQKENRERKKTEKKLQETAALYRHLMENSIDAVYLLSETGEVLNVNNAACEMIGYTKDELLALTIDDIDPNYPSQKFIKFWENKPEGSTVLFESLHKHKNGEIIPVEVNGIFFLLDGEKYLFGVARDIRKRKKDKEALKKNSERHRKAQALGKVGNWEYNIQTTEFWGSDQAKRIYGFDPASSSFSTEDVESCIPERERVHQALVDLIEKEKEYNIEFEIITSDTRERKTIVSVAELEKDEYGNPMKVTGVIQDITERKKIEERLRSAQKLVKTGYWDWFTDTGELIWSDAVYEIFGQHPDTFTVTAESFEQMIHPEDLHDFIDEREQALSASRDVDIEHRIVKPDGEIRYVHEIAEIIRDEKGEVIQVKGVVQDITDRKHIEEKFSQALEQKNELMQELNHRVKNNLLMVASLIELKDDDLGDKADLSELLHQIDAVRILHEHLYDSYVLTVSNTGKPFPEEIELDNPKTLGLRLISALVSQLEGTIELQRVPYPVFTIRFPVSS